MPTWGWLLVSVGVLVALYAGLVLALLLSGRRDSARGVAGFVPDCAILFSRLARDRSLPLRRRLVLLLPVGYLAVPFDLIPDFVPVIGYLDDALVVTLAIRWLLRSAGAERLKRHWPGPPSSLALLLRAAGHPQGV